MHFPSFFARLACVSLVFIAGKQPARAQQAELSLTGGALLSRSNLKFSSGRPAINGLVSLKSGVVFAGKWGVGLFYERTDLTAEVTHFMPTRPEKTAYSYDAPVARPQHSCGVEVCRKVVLTPKTHLRFGALLGYAWANVNMPTQPGGISKTGGASLAGGLDAAFVFPLLRRLSGVAGTGFRVSHLQYALHPEQTQITTIGVPLSVGLRYTFGRPEETSASTPKGGGRHT